MLVVDTSLKMSIGKTAAQCAHAAVGLVKNMHANSVPWLHAWEMEGEKTVVLKANSSAELEALEAKAQSLLLPTFMVSVGQDLYSEDNIVFFSRDKYSCHKALSRCAFNISKYTMRLSAQSVSAQQVEDAGRTEIAAGSKTVLGIAGVSEVVDQVTGRLSTLR